MQSKEVNNTNSIENSVSQDDIPLTLPVIVEGKEFSAGLIDTGAGISLMTVNAYEKLKDNSGVVVEGTKRNPSNNCKPH